jgi:lipopolysaccharide transport system permease protein
MPAKNAVRSRGKWYTEIVRMAVLIRNLWAYRGFILGSVKREFKLKYRNSMLGAAWTVINPLAMIFVYTIIFSQAMRTKLPGAGSSFAYSIYICSGILTWGVFAEIVNRSLTVFLDNANLLKKLNFPRLCLPIITVLNALLNFGIVFSLFTIFLIISDNFPGWSYLALLPVLIILIAFSAGLGITLGLLNVFFRDVGQLFAVVVQFWFWLTPIVYPVSILPDSVRRFLILNPMSGIIGASQQILVSGQWPDWGSLLPVTVLAVVLCFYGWRLFRKRSGEMVDEL